MTELRATPLTPEDFAPFGEVIAWEGAQPITINQGYAQRVNGLARVDVGEGLVNVSLFAGKPRPLAVAVMERHPLGSQAFYPLQDRPWLVVVCGNPRDTGSYRAFTASGRQGVNYAPNVWHHPLLVLDAQSRFIVVDRSGPGANLEEVLPPEPISIVL
ncbi:ureidoglycolate lyase [Aestuariivirga sp.]|uniref:ureidoglycolate lyase n=1 Tax=Aestuariivirga sp. TaxID=2650926 RepID=UPI0039E689B5